MTGTRRARRAHASRPPVMELATPARSTRKEPSLFFARQHARAAHTGSVKVVRPRLRCGRSTLTQPPVRRASTGDEEQKKRKNMAHPT